MPYFTRLSADRHLSFAALIAAICLPLSATADSGIGFQGTEATLGYISYGDTSVATADGLLDYAITRNHGLQLDLGTTSFEDHWQGTVSSHLYMSPTDSAKYGLFAAYTDINDDDAHIAMTGIEGLWRLSDGTGLDMRAGLGLLNPDNRDFIFASGHISQTVGPNTDLIAGLAAYDMEETGFASRDITVNVGAIRHFETAPIDLNVDLYHSFVDDTGNHDDETGLHLAMTWRPGTNAFDMRRTAWTSFEPVRPLTGLFARNID